MQDEITGTIVTSSDYTLFCQQRLEDPYPLFRRLREQEPVHWCDPLKSWLVTRYDDVFVALRDPRLSTNRMGLYMDPLREENRQSAKPLVGHLLNWMQNVDPPDHTRLRRLVNVAFTPRMLESMRPWIEQLVDQLIDDLCEQRTFDFVRSFSFKLTATVICRMLGIPPTDQNEFRARAEVLIQFSSGAGPGLNDHVDDAAENLQALIQYFDHIIEQRRCDPQDDLISAMLAVNENNDRFTQEELFAMCVFLFVAGHETTMSLISSGVMLLIRYPDQFEKLKANPDDLSESAVEEFTRYESPVTRAVRMAKEDIEIHDQTIRQGQSVIHILSAANRDPYQFPDPNRLDIARNPNKHVGFGWGVHFCLGAPLARLEASIAFRAIARRLPQMQISTKNLQWRPNLGLRSLLSLPITLS